MTTAKLIDVTPMAAEKLGEAIADEDGDLLRIMVMPGQNGSVQYALGVEKEAKDEDIVIDTDTIQVLVDSESAALVQGAQIDYIDGLMKSGFVISNPNFHPQGGCGSGGGCGCGGGGGGGGGCGCGGGGGGGCGGGGGGCGCGGH